ncbi:MAG: type I-E CRISPR-associated protein Cse2/CasB [Candidatus Nanoarchaeia archaeon]|jgi:CRISPR system Cascade subunit CasB|nr:type I-E CRISPR-associated protein Cse2/CasB [Candidatus Nanoarchaeia archaeon]
MKFVEFVIKQVRKNSSFRAKLSRADNIDTAPIAYECLGNWCDILDKDEFLSYATIGAALARAKIKNNGTLSIAEAIDQSYVEAGSKHYSERAASKLRRLLACDSVEELCMILRNVLRQVETVNLDYESLLEDIKIFNYRKDVIKRKWAASFYKKGDSE